MILIRTDANSQIGVGHLMRCLSIAHVFAIKGEEVVFVTADEYGRGMIERYGFEVICLNSLWSDIKSELPSLKNLINEYAPHLILVDNYNVGNEYFQMLCGICRLAYIDDINMNYYPIDYLINYNIFASVYDYSQYDDTNTRLILGPMYAPLREEFSNLRSRDIKEVSDVLISAGGSDPEKILPKIMAGLCPDMPDIRFHIMIGSLNPDINELKSLATKYRNTILHIDIPKISELMMNCDIAISAAGSTLYELCACGTPTITYTLADNQLIAAKQFEEQGIMFSAGDCRVSVDFIDRLKSHFLRLIDDDSKRNDFSNKMQKLIDGKGAGRLVNMLL